MFDVHCASPWFAQAGKNMKRGINDAGNAISHRINIIFCRAIAQSQDVFLDKLKINSKIAALGSDEVKAIYFAI